MFFVTNIGNRLCGCDMWSRGSEQIQRFECFSLLCLLSLFIVVFLVKVPMNEFLRLIFFSSLFWLRLHLKWSCMSIPDQRLYCVCVWYKFTVGQQRWLLSSRFRNPQIVFFLFFLFCFWTHSQGGKHRAEGFLLCWGRLRQFKYMANFLTDVFLFFYFSGICNISGIMFFQPSLQNYYHRKSGVYFALKLNQDFVFGFFFHDFTAVEKQQLYVSHIVCDLL